jgi:preprotein translocase subunit SecG
MGCSRGCGRSLLVLLVVTLIIHCVVLLWRVVKERGNGASPSASTGFGGDTGLMGSNLAGAVLPAGERAMTGETGATV